MTGLTVEGTAAVAPLVVARDVHKSYGASSVLKGMNLTVQPGSVVCLLGSSGSGKTTFLRCINHLEKIDAGRIEVDGALVGYEDRGDHLLELTEKAAARQRSTMAMVFQQFNLFPHMTVLQNLIEAPIRVKREPKGEVT